MQVFQLIVWSLCSVTLLLLAIAGFHRATLLRIHLFRRRTGARSDAPSPRPLPRVTIQLPVFNEANVAERLIRSAAAIRYPSHLLEVQVLDDSSDQTRDIVDEAAAEARRSGVAVDILRRSARTGFKAGALAEGLEKARGELLLILDADFLPSPDLLERVIPHFADPRVAVVQARWGHLNANRSLLTRAQALMLDGHFVLEHGGRATAGLFFNFNGSGGIWRRSAILDSGGWQSDTLTEDLDLSYRAQLRGWRFVFLPELLVPGELPESMSAFKSQQHRWAQGGVETALKLLAPVLSAALPRRVKVEAFFHLTSNLAYPLVLLLGLLLPVAVAVSNQTRSLASLISGLVVAMSTLSFATFYLAAARSSETRTWSSIPALFALGLGISVSQTHAVMAALRRQGGEFVRTPKTGTTGPGSYRLEPSRLAWLEVGIALYAGAGSLLAAGVGRLPHVPLLMLYAAGFGWVGLSSLFEQRREFCVRNEPRAGETLSR